MYSHECVHFFKQFAAAPYRSRGPRGLTTPQIGEGGVEITGASLREKDLSAHRRTSGRGLDVTARYPGRHSWRSLRLTGSPQMELPGVGSDGPSGV